MPPLLQAQIPFYRFVLQSLLKTLPTCDLESRRKGTVAPSSCIVCEIDNTPDTEHALQCPSILVEPPTGSLCTALQQLLLLWRATRQITKKLFS